MRKNIFFALLSITFALFVPDALGAHISISISDSLSDGLLLKEEITISLGNNTADSFTFNLPPKAYDVSAGGAKLAPVNGTVKIPLNCTSCRFMISYMLDDVTQREGAGLYVFSRTLSMEHPISLLIYEVKLPTGYVIRGLNSTEPSVVPLPSEIATDGKSIRVVWNQSTPVLPQRFYISFQSTESAEESGLHIMEELEEPGVILLMVISVIAGAGASYYFTRKYHEKKQRKELKSPKIPSFVLSPQEKEIIKLLKEHKGSMNQKEIVKALNWSKSKVSAVISNLEYKQLVKKEKYGRNYKVDVTKEVELE